MVKLLATENAAQRLGPLLAKHGLKPELVTPKDLDRLLGADAVHQGVMLEAEPLPFVALDDVDANGVLLVLDQVTDPQNVGAALRSAAAFGASGLVMTERHSPPLHGVLAKAASGALDIVPVILVKNLAQTLAELGERGVLRVGLAEEESETLESATLTRPLALVLGAEGRGLRQLTRKHCDRLCRISTQSALASLNVSNAAAVALHWASLNARECASLVAEAAAERIVPAVPAPIAIAGTGIAGGVARLLPIGIKPLREIDEGRAAAAALATWRWRRISRRAADAAGAAWRHRDWPRADDQTAHRNGIRRRHENRAAGSAALGAGRLDRRKVEAGRKQKHGGDSEHEFHLATPLEGRSPLT